jgi:hypothetical protein
VMGDGWLQLWGRGDRAPCTLRENRLSRSF